MNGTSYDPTMPDVIDPVEITSSTIFLAMGIPTFFVYFRILSHFCSKGFKSQFHKLFLICITNDMFAFLAQLFTLRLPTWGIVYPYRFVLTGFVPIFLNFLLQTTIMVQIFGVFLMALNRATCIAYSYTHEKIWNSYLKYFVLALFVGPILCNLNLLFEGSEFMQYGKGAFMIGSNSSPPFTIMYTIVAIIGILGAFILNCYNGFYVFKHIKKKKSRAELRDLKFHMTTLFTFMLQVIMMLFFMFIQFNKFHHIEGISEIMYYVYSLDPPINDSASLLPIWFVIYISEDFRWMVCGNCGVANRDADGNTIIVSTQSVKTIDSRAHHSDLGRAHHSDKKHDHHRQQAKHMSTERRLSN